MSRKIVSVLCAVIMISATLTPASVCFADPGDKITALKKGDQAPFDGILMSHSLAARIEAEKSTNLDAKRCAIRNKAAVALCESNAKKYLDIQTARYKALQEKNTQILKVKQDQIDFLRKNYLPAPWYKEPIFWAGVGTVLGVGLTVGAAHVVKSVR
jgi:hypothetical protein